MLASRWRLRLGGVLAGGSESLVLAVTRRDGTDAERACDLAVPMREWSSELRAAPVRLGRERCAYLNRLSGENERAIWQWGFMEVVSTM